MRKYFQVGMSPELLFKVKTLIAYLFLFKFVTQDWEEQFNWVSVCERTQIVQDMSGIQFPVRYYNLFTHFKKEINLKVKSKVWDLLNLILKGK